MKLKRGYRTNCLGGLRQGHDGRPHQYGAAVVLDVSPKGVYAKVMASVVMGGNKIFWAKAKDLNQPRWKAAE